jgi:phenylpropionate dioxygenase-like ring-hydroxylating dioxygenase large terminal subunit
MQDDFDRTGWNLKRAWVEVWNGMVFVSLARQAPESIAERLAAEEVAGRLGLCVLAVRATCAAEPAARRAVSLWH